MKAVAVLLLALVAVAYVAETEAAYCRTSAYKLPCNKVLSLKRRMFKECKLKVTVGKPKQWRNKCCTLVQKVKNEAAWEKYKVCEEKSRNYPLLKRTKDACKSLSAKKNC